MIQFMRGATLSAALLSVNLCAGPALGDSPFSQRRPAKAADAAPADAKDKKQNEEQTVLVREPGKPDRRCILLSLQEQPDGLQIYRLRALDNGEIITFHKRADSKAEKVVSVPDSKRVAPAPDPVKPAPTLEPPRATMSVGKEPAKNAAPSKRAVPAPAAVEQVSTLEPPQAMMGESKEPAKTAARITISNAVPPPPAFEAPRCQPAVCEPERPARGGLWYKLFGKQEPQKSAPSKPYSVCVPGSTAPVVKPAAPGVAQTVPVVTPAAPRVAQTVPEVKLAVPGVAPTVPAVKPAAPGIALIDMPGRSMVDNTMPDRPSPPASMSAKVAIPRPETEQGQFLELKEVLAAAVRPSQRIAAAEEMLLLAPGRLEEIRAVLLSAAQDDPAGCVRATCVHCLSKLRTRDQAFQSLLGAAQEDDDDEVREEADLALRKLTDK